MNVGELMRMIFGQHIPPTPPPPAAPPTPEEVRWARAEAAALIRRAKALHVEVELEQAGREWS